MFEAKCGYLYKFVLFITGCHGEYIEEGSSLRTQFMCDDRTCIMKDQICDTKQDCSGGEDERYCNLNNRNGKEK